MLKPVRDDAFDGDDLAAGTIFPIEARDIVVTSGERTLLDGASVILARAPRTVIMGPNGAGKSLLLRVLHGLVKPKSGRVSFGGRNADAAIRARQAMVFQKPMLLRRSARANITFVLSGMSRRAAQDRADRILKAARLSHVAASPARRLSGGEQQRLAIARALAVEPDVLFLDEPCANLDPASTLAVEEMIEGARAAGSKIVLVTHDIGQARRVADEIVFVSAGRVLEHTRSREFFSNPRSDAAAAYLEGRIYLPHSADGSR